MLNSSVPISSIFYYSVHLFSSSFPFSSLLCLLIFHLLYAFFFLMSSPLIFSLYHLLTSAFSTDSPPSCLCFPLQRRGRTAWVPTPEASRTPAPSATRTTVSTETASTPTASHLPPAGTERQGGRERKEGGKEGGEGKRASGLRIHLQRSGPSSSASQSSVFWPVSSSHSHLLDQAAAAAWRTSACTRASRQPLHQLLLPLAERWKMLEKCFTHG